MPKQKLTRRKDGRYACKRDGIFFYGLTPSEALEKRKQYDVDKANGLRHEASGILVSEYCSLWIAAYRSQSCVKSQKLYRKVLDQFIESVQDIRLSDVTPTDIQLFYTTLNGYSESHIDKYVTTINGLFRSAFNDRIILRNPAVDLVPPEGSSGTHRPLEPWERRTVHQLIDHRFGLSAMIMLYAGLRRGEVLALDLDRDIRNGRLYVRQSVSYSESCRGSVKSPKTYAGVRDLPLIEPLKTVLKGRHGKAFQSDNGDPTESSFKSAWNSYKHDFEKLSGQPCTIRTHDFRHSFCTMLFDAGVDMKTAMAWMGHSDDTMIRKIYDHLTDLRQKSNEAKLAKTVEEVLLKSM